MDYPIHIDTISMELPILCFKGSQGQNYEEFTSLKIVFILVNSEGSISSGSSLFAKTHVYSILLCFQVPSDPRFSFI